VRIKHQPLIVTKGLLVASHFRRSQQLPYPRLNAPLRARIGR
jgi:hypothetical protein